MREPGVRCCHPEVAQRAARFQCDPVLLRPLFSPSQNGRLMHGKRGMAVEVTSGGFRLRGFLGILDETMSFTGISFPPFPTFPGSPSPGFCLGECGECFWRGSALGFFDFAAASSRLPHGRASAARRTASLVWEPNCAHPVLRSFAPAGTQPGERINSRRKCFASRRKRCPQQ